MENKEGNIYEEENQQAAQYPALLRDADRSAADCGVGMDGAEPFQGMVAARGTSSSLLKVVLSWNEQQSATSYTIEVDETAMGVTVTKIENINGTSYNLINRFKELKIENGTYYFQIKANGPDTTSNTISFKYVSPQEKLSAPQNLRWDGTP